MRTRVILALCLSLLLISGVAVLKPNSDSRTTEPLISVENNFPKLSETYVPSTTANLTEGEPQETESLTTSDLVWRQFLTDYIQLASVGQPSEKSLETLADKYVDLIPGILSPPKINVTKIKVVTNSTANFQNYEKLTTKIESDRIQAINHASINNGEGDTMGPQFYKSAEAISKAYQTATEKLLDVPVPALLASLHTELINNHLSNSTGMKAISNFENDSVTAFSGIIAVNKNVEVEGVIINKIIAVLLKNGI